MPVRPEDTANSYCGRFVRWRVCCDRRDCIGGFTSWKMTAATIVEWWRASEVLHLVAVCEGDFTQRNPR